MTKKINLFSNLKSDFASGLVVFLVALPLCLGIALASGAPLFSGIISGVVGGIVVGYLSQSHLSVSGPAAGLTAIVLTAITDFGSFNAFLLAVLIAGIIQLILGFVKAGTISNYFPNNVIEGMLAGIGVIIILKQIPHAFGYDPDFVGDESFFQPNGQNTFSEIFHVFDHVQIGSIVIALISLAILIFWNKVDFLKKIKQLHPTLTPNDLRICAYLRLNLSSKEIAPLLNISVRSVEIKRYRLRKKMDLPHEKGLVEYILSI